MVRRLQRYDSNENTRETRLDIASNALSRVRTTPQGFLRIPAAITRVGVLNYTRADGSTVRELRHPDEVFKAESVDTLKLVPVTNDHPGMINPDNVDTHSIGLVAETVRNDGKLVNGDIVVQRKDAIADVKAGKLKELSAGYSCAIDPNPGVWQGQPYDQKQTDIIYNHVALGPAGWGRAGPEVALRMDAAVSGTEAHNSAPKSEGTEKNPMKKIRFTLDGVTYEIEVAETLAPTLEASLAKLEQSRADSKDAIAKAEGAQAAAQKEIDTLKERLDAATSPEALEALVKERTDVIEKAKKLAPEAKFDGLGIDEIRKQALESNGFSRETLDSKGSAFVEGAFEAAKIEAVPEKREPAKVPGVSNEPQKRVDAAEPRTAEQARAEMHKRGQEAWNTFN